MKYRHNGDVVSVRLYDSSLKGTSGFKGHLYIANVHTVGRIYFVVCVGRI